MATNRTILERAFFGKETCLIVSMNNKNECYFQFGKTDGKDSWLWKKVKMNDVELGDILRVLEQKVPKVSFFHSFGDGAAKKTTQIWIERLDGGNVSFRVREATRALQPGEQEVLIVILKHIILMMSLRL